MDTRRINRKLKVQHLQISTSGNQTDFFFHGLINFDSNKNGYNRTVENNHHTELQKKNHGDQIVKC